MPELPEVETTRRGIEPHITGQRIAAVETRNHQLRWPIPSNLDQQLARQVIRSVTRRGKYLLLGTDKGSAMIHLGMTGTLRIIDATEPPGAHDHIDIVFDNGMALRYRDPRKFGAVLWAGENPYEHKLLSHLGPEPLSEQFDTAYIHARSRQRTQAIKQFLMDSKTVVGVGNIYASESLYRAGINPKLAAGKVSKPRFEKLVQAIKEVLAHAIECGGTTLKDFNHTDGTEGYFSIELNVYDRADEPCKQCETPIKQFVQGGRSTYFCPNCQKR